MARKYTSHSAAFKMKVALEAAKNNKPVNQIAIEHGVHPAQDSWLLSLQQQLHNEEPAILRLSKFLTNYLFKFVERATLREDTTPKRSSMCAPCNDYVSRDFPASMQNPWPCADYAQAKMWEEERDACASCDCPKAGCLPLAYRISFTSRNVVHIVGHVASAGCDLGMGVTALACCPLITCCGTCVGGVAGAVAEADQEPAFGCCIAGPIGAIGAATAAITLAACLPFAALCELFNAVGSTIATPISLLAPEALSLCGIHYLHLSRANAEERRRENKENKDYTVRFHL